MLGNNYLAFNLITPDLSNLRFSKYYYVQIRYSAHMGY